MKKTKIALLVIVCAAATWGLLELGKVMYQTHRVVQMNRADIVEIANFINGQLRAAQSAQAPLGAATGTQGNEEK